MELLDYSQHQFKQQKQREMEVALTWNAIKQFFHEKNKDTLFAYIKSVRLTEKNIIISTEKPLVNQEISFLEHELLTSINQSLSRFWFSKREMIRKK